jgi:hypothetical protein
MAKYRITEDQLQKIFEKLEMNRLSEMNNYDYPAGSDTPDAPWNRVDPPTTSATTATGNYKLEDYTSREFLFSNKATNEILYTIDDQWEADGDIKDELYDFLEVVQEKEQDEDGYSMVDADNWKDYITTDEVAEALENYLNYYTNKNNNQPANDDGTKKPNIHDLEIVDLEAWENGEGKFLKVIDDKTLAGIFDSGLRQKAASLLSSR